MVPIKVTNIWLFHHSHLGTLRGYPQMHIQFHYPAVILIIIKYITRSNDDSNTGDRWNLRRPDWLLLNELLEEEIKNIKYTLATNINTLVNTFTNSIVKIPNLTIGKPTTKNKKLRAPWSNQNIKIAIMDKYTALKKFQNSKIQENFFIEL